MYIETERLVIRDLEPKDKYALFRIIYQPGMLRYMPDWAWLILMATARFCRLRSAISQVEPAR